MILFSLPYSNVILCSYQLHHHSHVYLAAMDCCHKFKSMKIYSEGILRLSTKLGTTSRVYGNFGLSCIGSALTLGLTRFFLLPNHFCLKNS